MNEFAIDFSDINGHLRRHELLPDDCSAVFVGGSLARGWAHARSDMDLVVVAPRPWASPSSTRQSVRLSVPSIAVEVLTVEGRRWEVKYWLTDQVEESMAKVSWDAFESAGPPDDLSLYENVMLERMCHAVVVDGASWFAEHRAAVLDSALNSIIALQQLSRADSALEDMAGLLESGHPRSAVVPGRNAFGYAVDALNASRGEAGLEAKWRSRRVEMLDHPVLPIDLYWAFELCADLDPRDPTSWLDELALLCGRLFLETPIGRRPAKR